MKEYKITYEFTNTHTQGISYGVIIVISASHDEAIDFVKLMNKSNDYINAFTITSSTEVTKNPK